MLPTESAPIVAGNKHYETERSKSLRHLDGRTVREVRKDDVLQAVELRLDARIDLLVRVPQEVRPPRADNVEIFLPVNVL